MATAVITLIGNCGGGHHLVVTVQANQGQVRTFEYEVDEMREPITPDDIREVARALARFHCQGMTNAEARAALQAGIDVLTSVTP